MKFDFAIGNPPYQEESNLQHELAEDNKRNFAPPVYNLFLEEAYKVADVVEMIHPARFCLMLALHQSHGMTKC